MTDTVKSPFFFFFSRYNVVFSLFLFPYHYRCRIVDLDESRDIQSMQNIIVKHVQSASTEALNYMNTFAKYEYVWLEDKQSYLMQFLNECKQKCLEDNDFPEDKIHDPNAQIDLFQAQVRAYRMCILFICIPYSIFHPYSQFYFDT